MVTKLYKDYSMVFGNYRRSFMGSLFIKNIKIERMIMSINSEQVKIDDENGVRNVCTLYWQKSKMSIGLNQ